MDDGDLHAFVEQFRRLTELAHERLPPPEQRPNELVRRLTAHLGRPARELPVITEDHPSYDLANVQVAVDAWRAAHGDGVLHGISGHGREHHSFTELITGFGQFNLGAVDYTSVPVGVDAERTCVRFGLYLLEAGPAPGAAPLAVLLRGADPRRGENGVRLEVLCRRAEAGRVFLAEIRTLMRTHNVFRRQVLSFEGHQFGQGVGPLVFHERSRLDRTGIILPDGVLDAVERQVVGVATHRDRLRRAGHPLKRGVLLFGPPGTGKTHTVRYLISQLPDFTVVLLSGLGLQFIQEACALARLVQPALVVLEDVDLVAESRSSRPGLDNPLLFQVLNEMDGLGGDADVAFLLTTNRVDLLEPALAERPGRVDLAVQVPLPDAAGRAALLTLYSRGVRLTAAEIDEIVAGTAGATASVFAELSRRAELLAASDGGGAGIDEMRAALAELGATRAALASGYETR
jgi:cell division protease FtsH